MNFKGTRWHVALIDHITILPDSHDCTTVCDTAYRWGKSALAVWQHIIVGSELHASKGVAGKNTAAGGAFSQKQLRLQRLDITL